MYSTAQDSLEILKNSDSNLGPQICEFNEFDFNSYLSKSICILNEILWFD